MSRMFKAVSGGTSLRALAEAPAADDVPFVEIGGPSGPLYSPGLSLLAVPAPAPLPAIEPPPEPAPAPLAERSFPRLAEPKYLSVSFHDLTGRPRNAAERDGPDAGLVALHLPDHPISGEYRTLRDEIRAQLPEPILLNLAVTLARESSHRVLVVDANVERPAIAEKFSIAKSVQGLCEVLSQRIPLAWAVQASTLPNLQILPAGTAAASFAQDMPKLMDQLRQWYDWVLIDGGVWSAAPERDGLAALADATYLVSRETDVDRGEFAGLRASVRDAGGLLRGYIATKV